MTALEAGLHELRPNFGQLLEARAEQIDALAARNLGVKAVFLCNLPEHHELLRHDFAARNTRHDRVEPPPLNVREVAIVRVLERRVFALQDHLVVQAREDARDGRLADLAAVARAVRADELLERAVALDLHDLEQLLAREREVLAELLAHDLTGGALLRLQDVGN